MKSQLFVTCPEEIALRWTNPMAFRPGGKGIHMTSQSNVVNPGTCREAI